MSEHIILLLTCYVIINGLQDKGFFDGTKRILPVRLPNSDTNSRQECGQACKNRGYILAGTENENECFCGNEMKDYGKEEDTECDEICTGNDDEHCGGDWRISIYNISQITHKTSTQVPMTRNTSSVIPVTNKSKSELVETALTTLAIYSTSLDEHTNIKTEDKNAVWLVYVIVPVVLSAAVAAITVIILKRRRKQRDVLPKGVCASGGSSQGLYENNTVFDNIVKSQSKKQSSDENLEMEQYSNIVKNDLNTVSSDNEYNVLCIKTANIANSGQENMQMLDNAYSHLSNYQSESDKNTLTDMYSHIESKTCKTISSSEDSYDRLK